MGLYHLDLVLVSENIIYNEDLDGIKFGFLEELSRMKKAVWGKAKGEVITCLACLKTLQIDLFKGLNTEE